MLNVTLINSDVGNGLMPYAPRKKPFWDALFGLGASLLGGFLGGSQQSAFTKEQQRLQSKLNREEQSHSMQLQRDQQEWLMNNQYGKAVSGMKNAGLNPAMAGGGSVGAAPAAGHPSSGASGPSASMPNIDLAGSAMDALKTDNELELGKAQKDLIKAQEEKTLAEKNKIEQNQLIDQWKTDPRVQELFKQGVDANVLSTYANADVSKAKAVEISVNANKLFNEIGLVQDQRAKCQADTAKTYTEIKSLMVGMSEAESRIALNYAEAALSREKVNTEKAKQADLYASSEHHLSSAGAEALRGELAKQQTEESKARQKGEEIANRINQWRQDVVEASGSKTEQGALMGAKRLVNLFNPLDHVSFSDVSRH